MEKGIFFSIITPTINRSCLPECVSSVNSQGFMDWEHIIVMDGDFDTKNKGTNQRHYHATKICYNDYGNTPRSIGNEIAKGKYVLYMDDDITWGNDYLRRLYDVLLLNEEYEWGVTNMLRFGEDFLNPAGLNRTDINQVFHKRKRGGELIRFPRRPDQNTDGHFVEGLKAVSEPLYVRFTKPRIIYKSMNYGKFF